jgi:predicted lipase
MPRDTSRPPASRRAAAAIAAIPLTVFSPLAPTAQAATSKPVDFAEIWRLSDCYRMMRYDGQATIHAALDPSYDELVVVDLAQSENRYMLGTVAKARRHEIWIRGTANTSNAFSDLEFTKRRDPRLGINLHRGFAAMALAVYEDLVPRLRPGYELVIFGHSLGAAEATILGMLLSPDGWKVTRVYASGSPRVTDAEGARKFENLPVLRIINEGDPVPPWSCWTDPGTASLGNSTATKPSSPSSGSR